MASNRNELTCSCADQIKEDRRKAIEESFAMTLYRDAVRQCKRLFIISVGELITILSIIGGLIWYTNM